MYEKQRQQPNVILRRAYKRAELVCQRSGMHTQKGREGEQMCKVCVCVSFLTTEWKNIANSKAKGQQTGWRIFYLLLNMTSASC